MNRSPGVTLDWETVDRITLIGLRDYQDSLKQQLEAHANGSWMHADDVVHNQKMLEALAFVIKDFDHGL
jgi:hypothetical protein